MKVLKFGGTSMQNAAALKKVTTVFKQNNNEQIIVVCSAMSGITNNLIQIGNLAEENKLPEAITIYDNIKNHHLVTAKELGVLDAFEIESKPLFKELNNLINGIALLRELSDRSTAHLTSFGERLSTRLLVLYLKTQAVKAQQFDATFIKTKGANFLEDSVDWKATKINVQKILQKSINNGITPVITGFFGVNPKGFTTLLGRGGSDYSGAILAVSLDIKKLEIWTDVDGFLSADPRIVDNAILINELGFQEASELCFFGAKVLHPKTIRPVIDNFGEVWIKNTFSPQKSGTKITQKPKKSNLPVISISSKKVILISLDLFAIHKNKYTILSELFSLAEKHEITIDMIAASEGEISFCIEEKYLENKSFISSLKKICPLYYKNNRSIICIVSPKDVKGQIGVAGKIFNAISKSNISVEMYSQNASEIAQLVVIKSTETNLVIKNLHKQLVQKVSFSEQKLVY